MPPSSHHPQPSVCTRHRSFFFFNDTATTEIYTLSLHDALPISRARTTPARGARSRAGTRSRGGRRAPAGRGRARSARRRDRESTRLNSSHGYISYAVFCLKKKKTNALTVPNAETTSTPDDVIRP